LRLRRKQLEDELQHEPLRVLTRAGGFQYLHKLYHGIDITLDQSVRHDPSTSDVSMSSASLIAILDLVRRVLSIAAPIRSTNVHDLRISLLGLHLQRGNERLRHRR
jgi:hypothetical protein